MADQSQRSFPIALIILFCVLIVASKALIVFGAMNTAQSLGLVLLGTGLMGLLITGAAATVTWGVHLMMTGAQRPLPGVTGPATEPVLRQILENSMLSDAAKRVLFRDRELELLWRAIEEDISRGDYNAGITLCDDMANLFGHREEAEAFRTRIVQAGHASYESKVHHALEHFEQVLATRDWARAHRDAASIRRLYPNHHLLADIDQRILRAREEHKHELENQFLDAAKRDDTEAAMGLLRQLDRYLTRDEAGRISPLAQEVVMKHRENLGTRFRLAVNDHRWSEAAHIGDAIMNQYPNTKMADEVRAMIETLRVRAGAGAVAGV